MSDELRDVYEVMREEMIMRDSVLAALKDGPKTVPEIAEALGHPAHEVMFWIMTARKYGYLQEGEEASDEGYFEYSLVDED
jgi:hypothetical protein